MACVCVDMLIASAQHVVRVTVSAPLHPSLPGCSCCCPQACRRKQTLLQAPAPLTIRGFYDALHKLAGMSGQGATARRQALVARLLRSARDVETRYLVRTLIMCLRVGAGYRSVLPPLAKAALLHRSMLQEAASKGCPGPAAAAAASGGEDGELQSAAAAAAAATAAHAASSVGRVSKTRLDAAGAAVLAAYHRCPNIEVITDVLLTDGPEALEARVQLSCLVPVKPMLARPCSGAGDALRLLSSTAATGAAAAAKGRVKPVRAGARGGGGSGAGAGAAGEGEEEEDAVDELLLQGSEEEGEGEEEGESGEEGEQGEDDDNAGGGSGDEGDTAADASATAAATAAAMAAVGAQQQQQLAGTGASFGSSSGSSSSLCVLAEFKYDGQRAQIHVSAELEVGGRAARLLWPCQLSSGVV